MLECWVNERDFVMPPCEEDGDVNKFSFGAATSTIPDGDNERTGTEYIFWVDLLSEP